MTSEDAGSHRTVRVGDEIHVTLPETATTGYRWQPELDDDLFEQVVVEPHATAVPRGAPGTRTIAFRARRPGRGVLRLVKRRAWEHESGEPAERFAVQLEIVPAG